MSLMKMRNRVGPRTEPWGTPDVTKAVLGSGSIDHNKLSSVFEKGFDPFHCLAGDAIVSEFLYHLWV